MSMAGDLRLMATADDREPSRTLIAFDVDLTGRVGRWSPGAAAALGWSASEVAGAEPPVPAPWLDIAAWTSAELGEPLVDHRVIWPGRDGRLHELAVCTTLMQGSARTDDRIMVWARDISTVARDREQLAVYAREMLESYGRELHGLADLEASYRHTVEALAVAVESKDSTTGGHIRRVSRLGAELARAHLGSDTVDPQLQYGFLLHDIGKLAVPDAVLCKPGALTRDEWGMMREHPREGARILSSIPFLKGAVDVVLHHHERWDGGGYPDGLQGETIPVGARLFSIADTIDAMTSDRPYRDALPLDAAVDEVVRLSGSQFDPACVLTLTQMPEDMLLALVEPHEAA